MVTKSGLIAGAATILVLGAACASSGAGGREVTIVQRDDGCAPASIAVQPGEKLKLVVRNESSRDYEIEGIDGTKLEELVVPKGKTRTPGYTVPAAGGTQKLKCYVVGGASTIIELQALAKGSLPGATIAAGGTAAPSGGGTSTEGAVAVRLIEYSVTPDRQTVKAGTIAFSATNASMAMKHELAVLRVKDDGQLENLGEVEPLAPGANGNLSLALTPGTYQLACLITKGQENSTVDHYAQGMHTGLTVE